MDLSVIIPCHNAETHIKPMLESLLLQTFDAEIELLFVCDSCEDNTVGYLETFWKSVNHRFTAIKITTTDVHRCGLARNVGLEESTGKYIWFLDSDDWLLDDWAFMKVITVLNIMPTVDLCQVDYKSATFPRGYAMMVWQYIFRRDAIKDIRFTGIQPCEDQEFMTNFEKSQMVKINGQDIYYYNYMRPNSNMWKFKYNQLESDPLPEKYQLKKI